MREMVQQQVSGMVAAPDTSPDDLVIVITQSGEGENNPDSTQA